MTPQDTYLMHINSAMTALVLAKRLNSQGEPFDGALAAVQNLNIATGEITKASQVLRFFPDLRSGGEEQS